MPENNQILSVEGQLVGMPTAGPESFSPQQLAYLKRALGVDETVLWTGSKVDGSFSLSESPSNFEKIEVWFEGVQTNVKDIFTFSGSTGIISAAVPKGDNLKYIYLTTWTVSGTTVTYSYTIIHGVNEGTQYKEVRIVKVKGINRISGGN